MNKSLKPLICNSLLLPGIYSVNATTYYNSNIGVNWTEGYTWITSGNGQASNATRLPQSRHMVSIEDGYTTIVNAACTTSNLFDSIGFFGIVDDSYVANCGPSVNRNMTINAGASTRWKYNRAIWMLMVASLSNQAFHPTPSTSPYREGNYLQ